MFFFNCTTALGQSMILFCACCALISFTKTLYTDSKHTRKGPLYVCLVPPVKQPSCFAYDWKAESLWLLIWYQYQREMSMSALKLWMHEHAKPSHMGNRFVVPFQIWNNTNIQQVKKKDEIYNNLRGRNQTQHTTSKDKRKG